MTEDRTTRRRVSLRKLIYIPLAVGVLAGAVGAGTGIGAAAPAVPSTGVTAPTSTTDTASASGSGRPGWDWWSLYNDTGKPIYGTWTEQTGGRKAVTLDLVKDMPLPSPGHESRPRNDTASNPPNAPKKSILRPADPELRVDQSGFNPYWWAHICYNHMWWNLNGTEALLGRDATFRLRGEYSGLQVTWNPYYDDVPNEAFLQPNKADGPC
ncbi:hypothetical protein R3Q06_11430 [Rhodococcus erythropolis]|uniref:hypothetical protein n=1 Tax=Rhodococcus erythropolis TaxID=1833 RepID=UPI00294A6F00|nr:hypothetical protein [Rhodococcus erythropolis]MDV6274112.1 hypothetical protein [Rhodococcus erythropolis]